MKLRKVLFTGQALADLDRLAEWISDHGSPRGALAFVEEIEAYCRSFDLFSERGTLRPDGLRSVGFQGCATIVFKVLDDRVEIVTVAYRGRSID